MLELKIHNKKIRMRTQSNYYENKVLGDLQTIIRTLRCESGGSGNCCPETNEILVNIKSNIIYSLSFILYS